MVDPDYYTGGKLFDDARRRADRSELAARLTGRDTRLVPFDAVRTLLRQQSATYAGIQNVPLEKIVGSVGRYREFNREFMPLNDSLRERWVNVNKVSIAQGWPPVDLYKIGDLFFVRDGNHRVSVARQMQNDEIEAHVWEYPIDVPTDPFQSPDEVLIRLGEKRFMEKTQLDQVVPEHEIEFTSPGRYSELLAQIADLQEKLTIIDGEPMSFVEASVAWYEMVYLPTTQIIQDSTLLEDFPGRTEADLFVWMSFHRHQLRDYYGETNNLAELAQLLAERYRQGSVVKMTRQIKRLLGNESLPDLVIPQLEEE